MKTIYQKLFNLKSKIGKISKDSSNPFFKSKYFDINSLLENVEPLMQENNLVLLQPILNNKVTTKIIDSESGEEISSEIELPNLTDPQKLGSAITYYRRYTLQSLLGIQAEDDDANKASGNKTAPKQNSQKVDPKLLQEVNNELAKTKSIDELNELGKKRKTEISSMPAIKAMFTNRKTQLNGNA